MASGADASFIGFDRWAIGDFRRSAATWNSSEGEPYDQEGDAPDEEGRVPAHERRQGGNAVRRK